MSLQIVKEAKPKGSVFVLSLIYNEQWFLPHFLAHYRALGIEHFVFYDDRSTDRTREILEAQDDCTIVAPKDTDGSVVPNAMKIQVQLTNALERQFGNGRWSLNADADEFLLLPSRFANLPEFVRHLDEIDAKSAFAAMVDFYPQRLSERFFDPYSPFQGCPYFDRYKAFRYNQEQAKLVPIHLGVRARLRSMLESEHPELHDAIYGDLDYRMAKLWKFPLVKTGEGVKRTTPHNVDVMPARTVRLALAHFKFFPELDLRLEEVLARSPFYGSSVEYRFIKAILDEFADRDLIAKPTVKYESPEDLERVGLLFAK